MFETNSCAKLMPRWNAMTARSWGSKSKASAPVKSGDFVSLRTLAEACKKRFADGVVLYDSNDFVPFGDRLAAAPLSCFWN